MKFDWCETNLNIGCGEYKYDHCEMCNIARAYQHGYEIAKEDAQTLDMVKHDTKARDNAYAEFVKSLNKTDREFVKCLLEEFESEVEE